jgi:DNA-binding GntR family transcriptional regulator
MDYIGEIVNLTDMDQYKPLNQIVYEGLRKAIISGKIPVNERINIKEYAERLNISRTPIREALRMLEKEGLVEYIPKYGVVVKKISAKDVKEIYKIRVALDILAFTNAMNLMNEEQFKQVEDLLNETEIAHKNHQIEEVTQLFYKFNEMIYDFSQMPRLKSIVINLREYLARFRDISMSGEARRKKALDEHWMIYKAMKNKNEESLKSIIKDHLEYSEQYVLKEIERIGSKKKTN